MEIKMYSFPPHGDARGQLVAIEENKDLPFDIKRVYYIYDTLPGVRRGFHAHRNLQQILLCVNGSCKIHLDNGFETAEVVLDKPNEGLYISNDMWREMYDFTPVPCFWCWPRPTMMKPITSAITTILSRWFGRDKNESTFCQL